MIIDIYKGLIVNCNMAFKDINKQTDDEQISRINTAGLTSITLENLWRDCYGAMASGDLVRWNRKLDAIWTNLGGDCKEDGKEEKAIKKIDKKIYDCGSLSNKRLGFSKDMKNNPLNTAKQYLFLKKKALFLRRLQNRQGKGTAYTSDDDDDID